MPKKIALTLLMNFFNFRDLQCENKKDKIFPVIRNLKLVHEYPLNTDQSAYFSST